MPFTHDAAVRVARWFTPLLFSGSTLAADAPRPLATRLHEAGSVVLPIIVAQGGMRFGSAVQIDAEHAVTNCHVVGPATTVQLRRPDRILDAPVLRTDRYHDLCLLAAPADGAPVASLRPARSLPVGAGTLAVGHGGGRLGYGSGVLLERHPMDGGDVLRTAATFTRGSSGGGLFDDEGRLVGVLTFFQRERDRSAYLAVPTEWIEALRRDHRDGRPAPVDLPAFWSDTARPDAPRFVRALQFELEERWTALAALADEALQADAGDATARGWRALAARFGRAATPDEIRADKPDQADETRADAPRDAGPGDAAALVALPDADCAQYGGKRIALASRTADRAIEVWTERWYLGVRTPDRGRHRLAPGDEPLPLGCSETDSGPQHWTLLRVVPLPR